MRQIRLTHKHIPAGQNAGRITPNEFQRSLQIRAMRFYGKVMFWSEMITEHNL